MSATVITSYQWISYSRLSSQWQTHQKFWPKKITQKFTHCTGMLCFLCCVQEKHFLCFHV